MNLRDEIHLAADIRPPVHAATPCDQQHVLLTGGSGYLGAFLVGDLLLRTDAAVHCLVRAESAGHAHQRLLANLRRYGIDIAECRRRLTAIPGDFSQDNLGLPRARYDGLAEQIDAVYHAGASVSFALDYDRIKPANVDGTANILRFACRRRPKWLHYVSTYAVFNTEFYCGVGCVKERPLAGDARGLRRGYGQSKWVAEGLCQLAAHRGLPVSVYRAGMISGQSGNGVCNPTDTMTLTMLAVLRMGAALNTDFLLHLTPVDYCSRAIVELAQPSRRSTGEFHLINRRPISWSAWLRWLADQGRQVLLLSPRDWFDRLRQTARQYPALLPLVLMLAFDPNKDFWNDSNIFRLEFDTARADGGLRGSGVSCPPVDGSLLQTYLDFLLQAGDRYFSSRL
jgi:glyine---[glycyl-carrier protein] ligase